MNDESISYYILIPAYNEASHIKNLIDKLKIISKNILVVDDGSKDNTLEIIKSLGVEYIAHTVNQGKGISLSDGYAYILRKNTDYVLTMDADGQHSPDDIKSFLDCARETKADIIVGNRMHNTKGMPLIRIITNKVMSAFISYLAGQRIYDSQCGFRLISAKVIESVDMVSKNFEAESEILIKASKKGFKIASAKIKTIYGNEKSKINPFIDTIRFFKLVIFNLKKK